MDISDAKQVAAFAQQAAALGRIRKIVHTAGVSAALSEPDQIVKVDVIGTAHLIDALEQYVGDGTVMVCVASAAGYMVEVSAEDERLLATTPTSELAALPVIDPSKMEPTTGYFVAKRANHVRVEAAAVRWGVKGARLLTVSPALIATPMGQPSSPAATGRSRRTRSTARPQAHRHPGGHRGARGLPREPARLLHHRQRHPGGRRSHSRPSDTPASALCLSVALSAPQPPHVPASTAAADHWTRRADISR